MAYSRFHNSCWYVFWTSRGHHNYVENRNNAWCAIWYSYEGMIEPIEEYFQAATLRHDLDKCLSVFDMATLKQIEEVKKYVESFLEDVDEKYPKRSTKS